MASWTTPVVHSTGDVFAVSDNNTLANDLTFLYQAPYCNYYNSVATSLTAGSFTQLTLGGTTLTGYSFSVSSNNVVVPLTGIYAVSFSVGVTPGGSGILVGELYVSGSGYATGALSPLQSATYGSTSSGATIVSGTASTTTLGLWGLQTNSTALNSTNTSMASYIAAFFVGSQ